MANPKAKNNIVNVDFELRMHPTRGHTGKSVSEDRGWRMGGHGDGSDSLCEVCYVLRWVGCRTFLCHAGLAVINFLCGLVLKRFVVTSGLAGPGGKFCSFDVGILCSFKTENHM